MSKQRNSSFVSQLVSSSILIYALIEAINEVNCIVSRDRIELTSFFISSLEHIISVSPPSVATCISRRNQSLINWRTHDLFPADKILIFSLHSDFYGKFNRQLVLL